VKTLDPVLSLKPFKERGPDASSKRIFCCKGESLPKTVWSKTALFSAFSKFSKNYSPTERLNFFSRREKKSAKIAAIEHAYMPQTFSPRKNLNFKPLPCQEKKGRKLIPNYN
jgi:hypothetical protein